MIGGNTAKVDLTFRDFAGALKDPVDLVFTLYDVDGTTVLDTKVLVAPANRVSTGIWVTYQVLPLIAGTYHGVLTGLLDGYPLRRPMAFPVDPDRGVSARLAACG